MASPTDKIFKKDELIPPKVSRIPSYKQGEIMCFRVHDGWDDEEPNFDRHRVRVSAVANFNKKGRHYAYNSRPGPRFLDGPSPRLTSRSWQRSMLFGRRHRPMTKRQGKTAPVEVAMSPFA